MVSKEFIVNYLENDFPKFKDGETIPAEISEIFVKHSKCKRIDDLFQMERIKDQISNKIRYPLFNIEFKCPTCGKIQQLDNASKTYILNEFCSNQHKLKYNNHIFFYSGDQQCKDCEKLLGIQLEKEYEQEKMERQQKEEKKRLEMEKKEHERLRLLWIPIQEYLKPYEGNDSTDIQGTFPSAEDENDFLTMTKILVPSLQNNICLTKFKESVQQDEDTLYKSKYYNLCINHYETPPRESPRLQAGEESGGITLSSGPLYNA